MLTESLEKEKRKKKTLLPQRKKDVAVNFGKLFLFEGSVLISSSPKNF